MEESGKAHLTECRHVYIPTKINEHDFFEVWPSELNVISFMILWMCILNFTKSSFSLDRVEISAEHPKEPMGDLFISNGCRRV